MTLGDLLDRALALVPFEGREGLAPAAAARRVAGIEYDSRKVGSGAVFVAVRGQKHDATAFAPQAVARGAVAVVAEVPPPSDVQAPWLTTPNARLALAALAVVHHGEPADALRLVGITGTNGKTTTSYLLGQMLEHAGWRCGRIGTVSYRVGAVERDAPRTTPEAPDVQRLLREMVDEDSQACVMEVSSHALALHRVEFVRFAGALFTNLTRDHLDFHAGMEDYFAAKRRLFTMLRPGAPILVNADDPYGRRLAQDIPGALTYALDGPADIRPTSLSLTRAGLSCELKTPQGVVRLESPLLGRPNAYNLIAATGMALALGVPAEVVESAAATVSQVPGRFERVSSAADDLIVIVDYAHTDDALKNLLETARPLSPGRMVTVFGCGGDRDRTKRSLMGAVAGRLSDHVVLTSDNPRSEDPQEIIEEIKRGLVPPERPLTRGGQPVLSIRTTPWLSIVDRRAAIWQAIGDAEPGDLIVIAGKGHEKYQEIAGKTYPFDDVTVAREALDARRASGTGREGATR